MDAAEGKPKGKAAISEANTSVGDSTTTADKVVMDDQNYKFLIVYFIQLV